MHNYNIYCNKLPQFGSNKTFKFPELFHRTNIQSYFRCRAAAAVKDHRHQGLSGARKYLLKGFGPVLTVDVPQVPSVLDLVVSDLLVLQPHNEIPELCLICGQELKKYLKFWSNSYKS